LSVTDAADVDVYDADVSPCRFAVFCLLIDDIVTMIRRHALTLMLSPALRYARGAASALRFSPR